MQMGVLTMMRTLLSVLPLEITTPTEQAAHEDCKYCTERTSPILLCAGLLSVLLKLRPTENVGLSIAYNQVEE